MVGRSPSSNRLRVEALEDRCTPATLVGLTTTNTLISFDSATPGTPVPAQVDYFLKLKGLDGDVTDAAGEIELLDWSWGVTNAGTHGSSAPVFKASPKLFLACATGSH